MQLVFFVCHHSFARQICIQRNQHTYFFLPRFLASRKLFSSWFVHSVANMLNINNNYNAATAFLSFHALKIHFLFLSFFLAYYFVPLTIPCKAQYFRSMKIKTASNEISPSTPLTSFYTALHGPTIRNNHSFNCLAPIFSCFFSYIILLFFFFVAYYISTFYLIFFHALKKMLKH